MTTRELTPGTWIIRSDGKLDRITSTVRRTGEPARLVVASDRSEWIAENCRAATLHDFKAAGRCYDSHGAATGRAGFTLACSCTRLYGGAHWVLTPCCHKGRRGINSGDTVCCPKCGWYWSVFIAPGGTRWVSKGYGKSTRRQFTRGATGRAIGSTQYEVLCSLARYNSAAWWPGCGWHWHNTSTTARALVGLARLGLVEDLRHADGPAHFRITEIGRAELPRSLRTA